MAKIPALPKLTGLETNIVTTITPKKITPFARRIASKKLQLTVEKSSLASDTNIRDGNANVPTKVPMPFDSDGETTFKRPATYLKSI